MIVAEWLSLLLCPFGN